MPANHDDLISPVSILYDFTHLVERNAIDVDAGAMFNLSEIKAANGRMTSGDVFYIRTSKIISLCMSVSKRIVMPQQYLTAILNLQQLLK